MIGLLEFDISHSKIFLAVCENQLLYNPSLIELCSVCVKQTAAVKTASDAYPSLTK